MEPHAASLDPLVDAPAAADMAHAGAHLHAVSLKGEFVAMLRLGVPLAAANLLQMAVYAIDVIFVAQLGTKQLAAITLATSVYGIAIFCSLGLIGAVAPMAATALGRGRHALREMRRSFRMGLWMSAFAGIFVMIVALGGEPLMHATGQDPEVANMAGDYLQILSIAAIPVVASNVLRIFVSTLDKAVIATWVTVLALVVNSFGNWVLIFGNLGAPALGLRGAALASLITGLAVLAAYIAIIQADRHMRRHYLFGRLWKPDWPRLAEIWRIGLPIAALTLAEGGLFGAAAFLTGALGALQLAAHTVALQLAALAFQVPFGFGQAATIRVGLHNGAGSHRGVHLAGIAIVTLTLGLAIVFALAMVLIPHTLLSIYIDIDDTSSAELLSIATALMLIAAGFQLFDGAQAVLAGLLRGLADTRIPFVFAVIGYWVCGFVTAWYLAFHTDLGAKGVWIGLATGLFVTSLLMGWRWHRRERLGLVTGTI